MISLLAHEFASVKSEPFTKLSMKRIIFAALGILLIQNQTVFAQRRVDNYEGSKTYCVLPLPADLGIGSQFDGGRLTTILNNRLKPQQKEWCTIPAWLGGLWLQRFGRDAVRRGFVPNDSGYWHYIGKPEDNPWKLTKESGTEFYDYSFAWKHEPVINKGGGSINFRQSTIWFRVSPEKGANGVVTPKIVDVWQEDHQDLLRKSAANLLEHSVASRIYSSKGNRLDNAPYPRMEVGSGGLVWTESKVAKVAADIPIDDPIAKNFTSNQQALRSLQLFLRRR